MKDPNDPGTLDLLGAPTPRRPKRTKEERAEQARIRMQRMRERKRAAGLAAVEVPWEIAEQIRTLGLDGYLDRVRGQPAREIRVEVPVEKIVVERIETPGPVTEKLVQVEKQVVVEKPVPAKLSAETTRLIELGRRVESLPGWKRSILNWLGV